MRIAKLNFDKNTSQPTFQASKPITLAEFKKKGGILLSDCAFIKGSVYNGRIIETIGDLQYGSPEEKKNSMIITKTFTKSRLSKISTEFYKEENGQLKLWLLESNFGETDKKKNAQTYMRESSRFSSTPDKSQRRKPKYATSRCLRENETAMQYHQNIIKLFKKMI